MEFGICIVALGYEIYGSYALNLAISLRVYDPNIKIAILCEPKTIAHLTEEELSMFSGIITIPEEEFTVGDSKQYQRVKLLVYKYTPFERTMYMDADNIWLDKKVSWLYGEIGHNDFYIGYNGEFNPKNNTKSKYTYTYWGEPAKICKYFGIKNLLPQTVSGFYYFKKTKWVEEMFEEALRVYDDPKAPTITWAGGKADEYCFNVALAKKNYTQKEFHVFYFDKINGRLANPDIYKGFWGIATGGNKVKESVVILYNKLVNKYCIMLGILTRKYHIDKADVIASRKSF